MVVVEEAEGHRTKTSSGWVVTDTPPVNIVSPHIDKKNGGLSTTCYVAEI